MKPAPKRRWFRFSLRTLFVTVTAVAILTSWLVWNWVKVRERERLLESLGASSSSASANERDLWIHRRKGAKPPWLWHLMGATNDNGNILCQIELRDGELDRIQALLPDYELTLMPVSAAATRPSKSSVERILDGSKLMSDIKE